MFVQIKETRKALEARDWQSILEAWGRMPEDEETVVVDDIVPIGFSDSDLAAGRAQQRALNWVWCKV